MLKYWKYVVDSHTWLTQLSLGTPPPTPAKKYVDPHMTWKETSRVGTYNTLLFKVSTGWLDELNCRKKLKKINVVVLGKKPQNDSLKFKSILRY